MTYYVEYSGGMEVEADSEEEAVRIASEELLDLDMTAHLNGNEQKVVYNCEDGNDMGVVGYFESLDDAIFAAENNTRVKEVWSYVALDNGEVGDVVECVWRIESEDTHCRIEWADDGGLEDVIIRSTEYENDPDDEEIFYYGMSRQECIEAMQNKTAIGDFMIVDVY